MISHSKISATSQSIPYFCWLMPSKRMVAVVAMVKPSLQPAGQTGSYSREDVIAEASHLSLENRNPNVTNDRTMTTVKRNVPKSPGKPKNRTPSENDLVKPPFQRTLGIDDEGYNKVTAAKSPENSGGRNKVANHMGTPPRKHFCRSPRCSANNPDYAVPVARTYLRSKRHSPPGWQFPAVGRAKVPISPMIDETRISTFGAAQGISSQELVKEERRVACNENVQLSEGFAKVDCAEGVSAESLSGRNLEFGVTASVSAHILVLSSAGPDFSTSTLQKDDEDRSNKNVEHGCMKTDPREALLEYEESIGAENRANAEWRNSKNRPSEGSSNKTHGHRADRQNGGTDGDYSTIGPIQSAPTYKDDEQGKGMNDTCMQEMPDDVNIRSMPPASIGGVKTAEQPPGFCNSEEMMPDVSIADIMARGGGTYIGSNFPMRLSRHGESLAGDDLRSNPVSSRRLSMRGYQRMRLRRCSTDSNCMASSKESVPLQRKAAIKRKQARDWMWDSAVKLAVSRLASQSDCGVNVLVQAFESISLTEKALESSEYVNITGDVLQLDNIRKIQARDESIAGSGEYRFSDRNVEQGSMGCGTGGCVRGSGVMRSLRACEDVGIMNLQPETIQQKRLPRPSSNSESSELGSNEWASFKNADMDARNDACGLKGTPSNSGLPDMSKWTYRRLSRSRSRTKHQRKWCTSMQPFKLHTEERGAVKEEEFSRKLQQLWAAEQRLRIPIAQGLPWTTDEPEVPPKPLAKEQTRAECFRLETGFRAVERTEFDKYVADRQLQLQLQRQEELRYRQVATAEDIKRLRRQMVPRAQLMPYFDQPFMPHRSLKRLTVPKQPNFHHTQHKKARCSVVS